MSHLYLFAFQALLKIMKHQVGYISAFRENYVQGFLNVLLLDCKAVYYISIDFFLLQGLYRLYIYIVPDL